jgi:hypothetical protein
MQDSNPHKQALTAELITRVAYNYHWAKTKGSFSGGAADAGEIFLQPRRSKTLATVCVPWQAGKRGQLWLGFAPALNYYYAWVCVKLLRWRV